MADILGAIAVVGFIVAGLLTIPLDRALERRRARNRWRQAHRKRTLARRAAARWHRA